jgi:long-chain acyl-CoA synthetase
VTSIISGERQISYSDIHARIARAAAGFRRSASVAATRRHDAAQRFCVLRSLWRRGGAGQPVVPINWHLKAEEVAYILADSGAKSWSVHADLLPQIREACPAISSCWW